MAELKDEDIKRLASDFLTTKADQNETAALHLAIENNPAAALELLAQVQAAREGARTGLSAEQNEGVRPRVEALITAHARKRGIFGIFKKRPKPVPAPEAVAGPASAALPALVPAPAAVPAVAPVPAAAPVPTPAPVAAPSAAAQPPAQPQAAPPLAAREAEPETDMEDTAPIAEIADAAPGTPRLGAPGSALAAMQAAPSVPLSPPVSAAHAASTARPAVEQPPVEKPVPQKPAPEKPAPEKPVVQKPMIIPAAVNFGVVPESPQRYAPVKAPARSRKGMAWLLVLALVLALGYYYRGALLGMYALYASPAPPVVHPVRTAPPPAAVQGPAVRADAAVPALDAPLPAELPKP